MFWVAMENYPPMKYWPWCRLESLNGVMGIGSMMFTTPNSFSKGRVTSKYAVSPDTSAGITGGSQNEPPLLKLPYHSSHAYHIRHPCLHDTLQANGTWA